MSNPLTDQIAEQMTNYTGYGRPHTTSKTAIKRIKELHEQGISNYAIAKKLNEEGVPTPTGQGKWVGTSIKRALGWNEVDGS